MKKLKYIMITIILGVISLNPVISLSEGKDDICDKRDGTSHEDCVKDSDSR